MAAKELGKTAELRFERVELPVGGTNFQTEQDVLQAADETRFRIPKSIGRRY